MKPILTFLLLTGTAFLVGCGSDTAPEPPHREAREHDDGADDTHAAADHGDHDGGDIIRFSPEAAQEAGIELATAETGAIRDALSLPAEIRFDADRVANIAAMVDGTITALDAGEGDTVAEGQRLGIIASPALAGLKADYLSAATAERLARTELTREEALWADKITAQADVQNARSAFVAAKARREAAENKLHAVGVTDGQLEGLTAAPDGALSRAQITAPIAGTVVRRPIRRGEAVSAGSGQLLFSIADDSVLWADIAVYKQDLGQVVEGAPVRLVTDAGLVVADGEIAYVLPVIDETSRTATARVIVENADGRLRPGQFLTAQIALGGRELVRVPLSAVQTVEDRMSVFVPTEHGFVPRPVEVSSRDGDSIGIIDGLEPGERYVAQGAFTLKAQLEKAAFGDGHNH